MGPSQYVQYIYVTIYTSRISLRHTNIIQNLFDACGLAWELMDDIDNHARNALAILLSDCCNCNCLSCKGIREFKTHIQPNETIMWMNSELLKACSSIS